VLMEGWYMLLTALATGSPIFHMPDI
jgi:hypothetical protein